MIGFERWLPVASIMLNTGAAIGYACAGDFRHFVYWASAATITASVTF